MEEDGEEGAGEEGVGEEGVRYRAQQVRSQEALDTCAIKSKEPDRCLELAWPQAGNQEHG